MADDLRNSTSFVDVTECDSISSDDSCEKLQIVLSVDEPFSWGHNSKVPKSLRFLSTLIDLSPYSNSLGVQLQGKFLQDVHVLRYMLSMKKEFNFTQEVYTMLNDYWFQSHLSALVNQGVKNFFGDSSLYSDFSAVLFPSIFLFATCDAPNILAFFHGFREGQYGSVTTASKPVNNGAFDRFKFNQARDYPYYSRDMFSPTTRDFTLIKRRSTVPNHHNCVVYTYNATKSTRSCTKKTFVFSSLSSLPRLKMDSDLDPRIFASLVDFLIGNFCPGIRHNFLSSILVNGTKPHYTTAANLSIGSGDSDLAILFERREIFNLTSWPPYVLDFFITFFPGFADLYNLHDTGYFILDPLVSTQTALLSVRNKYTSQEGVE